MKNLRFSVLLGICAVVLGAGIILSMDSFSQQNTDERVYEQVSVSEENKDNEATLSGFLTTTDGAVPTVIRGMTDLHKGIDLVTLNKQGDARAFFDGTVVFAGESTDAPKEFFGESAIGDASSGYGNCVLLKRADGAMLLYAHLASLAVSTGDVVHAGTVLGPLGQTGSAMEPNLHIEFCEHACEIDRAGNLVDPMKLVKSAVVGG